MSFINDTRWNTILTKLNQKRTDGGFSPVSSVFSDYLKQSNIDTLRNGTNDILTKYQYTDLSDALNNVGYAYDIWKSWDYNFIATRSLDEIEDILDTMWYKPPGTRQYLEDIVISGDLADSYDGDIFSPYDNYIWLQTPAWVASDPRLSNGLQLRFKCPLSGLGEGYGLNGSYIINATLSFVKIDDSHYKIKLDSSLYYTCRSSEAAPHPNKTGSLYIESRDTGTTPVIIHNDYKIWWAPTVYTYLNEDIVISDSKSVITNYHDSTEAEWGHD